MKPLFPPIENPAALPKRVLVFAPHADDEVFGCGGMLAFHTQHGAEVRVVVVSDGSAGDPRGIESDIARTRIAESRAAGEELGVSDYRFLGLPDGRQQGELALSDFRGEDLGLRGVDPPDPHQDRRRSVYDQKVDALSEHQSQLEYNDLLHMALAITAQRSMYVQHGSRHGDVFRPLGEATAEDRAILGRGDP